MRSYLFYFLYVRSPESGTGAGPRCAGSEERTCGMPSAYLRSPWVNGPCPRPCLDRDMARYNAFMDRGRAGKKPVARLIHDS